MAERISARDGTFLPGYCIHIQRYDHALPHCRGKRVLDAGCGIGYGSHHLARHGAAEVIGVDISKDAIGEARATFRRPNLSFTQADLLALDMAADLPQTFDVIVNLENIEHLPKPGLFLAAARKRLEASGGILVLSTPNANMGDRKGDGTLANEFHEKEYTAQELRAMLSEFFPSVVMSGQWRTPDGRLRARSARAAFDHQCEAYYNPMARLGRAIKRVMGKPSLPPPVFLESGDSYSTDTRIAPLDAPPYDWEAEYLLAVCGVAHVPAHRHEAHAASR
jgi:2-polyprenyl-3-methyl-5-hydroxy-6-metoxy-1,4-benzoquinol methylase